MAMHTTSKLPISRKSRTTPPTAQTSALYRDLTALLYRQITALPAGRQHAARAAARQDPEALRAHLWADEPAFDSFGVEAPAVLGVLTFVFDHVDWAALAARLCR